MNTVSKEVAPSSARRWRRGSAFVISSVTFIAVLLPMLSSCPPGWRPWVLWAGRIALVVMIVSGVQWLRALVSRE